MPEAAVDENSNLLPMKVEVGLTENFPRMQPPPANSAPNECKLQYNLGCLVALAANGRHNTGCRLADVLKPAIFELASKDPLH